MIFAIRGHIEAIIEGTKTQTRRATDRYRVGKLYAIQASIGLPGISGGKIRILNKWQEWFHNEISPEDAKAEGGYTSKNFERVYDHLHPGWISRWAYKFEFVPSGGVQ